MRFVMLTCLLIVTLLLGCGKNSEKLVKQFAPPEDEAKATNYIALLRQGNYEAIQKDSDPGFTNTDTRNMLVKMAALIPSQEPKSVKTVGAQQNWNNGVYKIYLSYEYEFPTNWILISLVLQGTGENRTINGFHVRLLPDSLENLNRFTFTGKNLFQDMIFASAVLIPIFILFALVLCIYTKMAKRKWPWIVFILFGFGEITVNWTTGQWQFGLLHFQLFGVGAFAPPFGAWLITVSVPLGAIIFVLKRKELMVQPEVMSDDAKSSGDPDPKPNPH